MSKEERRSKQLQDEGYVYAGLFGLDLLQTMKILRRLLKPFGLEISNIGRVHGDDTSYVRISGNNAIKAAIEVWQRFLDWGPCDDGSPEGKALEKALTELRDALPAHPRNNRKSDAAK